MATRESLMGQWNNLEDRPLTESERKFNDNIDQMLFDNISNEIIKRAIIGEAIDEPRD